MVFDIKLIFTGLMIICFENEQYCPTNEPDVEFPNTAWTVNADGASVPCGWNAPEQTELRAYFPKGTFKVDNIAACNTTFIKNQEYVSCPILGEEICVDIDSKTPPTMSNMDWIPRLDDIDLRFAGLRTDRLMDKGFVSTRIHFENGGFEGGPRWTTSLRGPIVEWNRSDGSGYKKNLSDRMLVRYSAVKEVTITDCKGANLYKFNPLIGNKSLTLGNLAKAGVQSDSDATTDRLPYLLWYYPLASWDGTKDGLCPTYISAADRDAVVLQCTNGGGPPCYQWTPGSSVYWPVVRGPSK